MLNFPPQAIEQHLNSHVTITNIGMTDFLANFTLSPIDVNPVEVFKEPYATAQRRLKMSSRLDSLWKSQSRSESKQTINELIIIICYGDLDAH